MTEENLVDSEVAAMLLGISTNNLRQIVYRKALTARGRKKRKSLFLLEDIYALQKSKMKDAPAPLAPEANGVSEQ